MRSALDDWLRWQESLSPHEIDLGLDRVRAVLRRLALEPPTGGVFTIAGTNGKGSTAAFLESLLMANGVATGMYTSPHLVRYNERVRVNGAPVEDSDLIEAFEAVESVRDEVPLTYFEFGTLAAMMLFDRFRSEAWILEVGLGGRLDAVNVIDPDYSLITTVALDHQEWLGQTLDAIAAEKAGIMRPATPAFYGDEPIPGAVTDGARELGADLRSFGRDFSYAAEKDSWTWRGAREVRTGLPYPEVADSAQMRNISLALAAVEARDPLLLDPSAVDEALREARPAGRFQIVQRKHQWILDVAHNPQAAATVRDRIRRRADSADTTVVVGMLAGKQAEAFASELLEIADRWVVCTVDDARAFSGPELAASIEAAGGQVSRICQTPDDAFEYAARVTSRGGRILVCGSFRVVGPALVWLGLY